MGRVAIVIGHNKKVKGAYSKYLKISEWDFYKDISEKIREMDTAGNVDIYFRNYHGSYSQEMRELTNKLNRKDYKLIIELHFNSSSNPLAYGAEVLLFHSSKKGIKESVRFLNNLREEYENRIRGLVPVTKATQRGGMGICNTKAPYILIEPFFASNRVDAEKFEDRNKLARFIYNFLTEVE